MKPGGYKTTTLVSPKSYESYTYGTPPTRNLYQQAQGGKSPKWLRKTLYSMVMTAG